MAELIALLDAGSVYVNVGTSRHRDGELRGQLTPLSSESTAVIFT